MATQAAQNYVKSLGGLAVAAFQKVWSGTSNETLLYYLLQAPNGGVQSFLVLNPAVSYYQMTKCILDQLSNDDTNAMRRTNSTMNNSLMALKQDGTFRHRQEDMRDKCDVTALDKNYPHIQDDISPCLNGVKAGTFSHIQLPEPAGPNLAETRPAAQIQQPPPSRRSARLNPTETSAAAQIRLARRGTARRPNTEPQGPDGFSIPSPRRRKSPRGNM